MTRRTMPPSMRRPRQRRRRLGLAAIASSAALLLSACDFNVYDIPLPGGADVGDNPYEVTVEFRDVLDLVPQSVVKVDDVTVGMVKDVSLRGYVAQVTLELNEDVELPENATAQIRQTSLLGEKFVSLEQPVGDASSRELKDGDRIPLERSGRNPEVEEVLGALSLILNGGGVGQLKTITKELNVALDGREGEARSVLNQVNLFMGQLDDHKDEILQALDNVNELSKSVTANTDTLDLALRELPSAIKSIDSQRDDLVKMLRALADLSATGIRVIKASKAGTIESLNKLWPVLREIDRAGNNFPRSLQVFLTYPFVDAVVGKTAQAARDLHMGDYTNLSINLQVKPDALLQAAGKNLGGEAICLGKLCVDPANPGKVIEDLGGLLGGGDGGNGGGNGGGDGPLGGVLGGGGGTGGGGNGNGGNGGDGGGLLGLGRAATDGSVNEQRLAAHGVDGELAGLLAWGVVPR